VIRLLAAAEGLRHEDVSEARCLVLSTGELKERVLKRLRTEAEGVVKLCSGLVKVPSENPPGDMTEMAGFIRDWLAEQGLRAEAHEPKKGAINLIVRVGDAEEPCLALGGHMDVVPAGDRERWSVDPYSGEVRDGRVWGRGATDMKGGLACLMFALAAIAREVEHLPGTLLLAITPDEETGGQHGARWLVEQGLLHGDACLMAEPSTIHASVVAEKGICWLRLRAPGRPAHGSLPMLGENAIEKAARAMEVLKGLEELEVKVPEELAAVVESSRELFRLLAPSLAEELGLPPEKAAGIARALDHITVNFGIIKGGTKVNMVPEACELDVDVRVPPGFRPEDVLAWVKSKLAEASLGDVSCEVVHSSEPNYTPPSSRIFGLLRANAREIAGLDVRPIIITGGTDARFLRWRGVPTIHYGPGVLHKAHAYDEFVEVRDLKVATLVLAGTMLDFILDRQVQP